MTISIIVAASENNAIGKNNNLLWKLPNDMLFFKNTTWAMPVIMGRKTFESLGKCLQGRENIIISSNKNLDVHGGVLVSNLNDAINEATKLNTNEIFIIGGGKIYEEAIEKLATRIYMTRVHENFFDADIFFPKIDETNWQLIFRKNFYKDEKHNYDYSFETWERKTMGD